MNRCLKHFLLITIITFSFTFCKAEVFYKIVEPGTTIKMPRIPDPSAQYIYYIKNGIYEGQVEINVDNVCIIGESVDGVIFTNGFYNGDGQSSTATSATFIVGGDNFYCENVTIKNSAGNVGQAVAVRPNGDYEVFNNCKFIGFQDTYYAYGGIQYNYNCYIEGGTDFIFGESTGVFDSCTIMCVSEGQYVTAPADSKMLSTQDNGSSMIHGLLFLNSRIEKGSSVSANSYYLGRPWQDASSSVYVNCTLGNHINSVGWAEWDADESTVYFAEYKSVDQSGTLVDVSSRATWSYQIPDSIAEKYYTLDYFLTGGGTVWDAKATIKALAAPANVAVTSYTVSWDAVDNALGYVIIRNDSTVGTSEITSFADETVNKGIVNVYAVKSVNSTFGNLSELSKTVTVAASGIQGSNKTDLNFYIAKNMLYVNSISTIKIFSISGILIASASNVNHLNLSNLQNNTYICHITDSFGNVKSSKIIL